MSATTGTSVGPYRVEAQIGAGGMGEVYRARDSRLNRDVALKVLPPLFANETERMNRFQREAQVLAALNHPNIAHIYGLEEANGIRALVMELVEGPTLADRIANGPVPLEEALCIARQIAEALEYAHDKGIIHRDLKPSNVKLTGDGKVKLLDFGLAKALEDGPAAEDISRSPTLSMAATRAGVILGTAAYMSPEQAKGKKVDRRADIWAFGVVLVEMLTGRQMYIGETASETLAAVIKDVPDLTALPQATPTGVRRILRRCLEKDPRRRLQAIGEARFAFEEPEEETAPATVPVPVTGKTTLWKVCAAALVLVAAGALGLWWRATRPVLRPMLRFHADLGSDAVAGTHTTVAISPDGMRIAYPVRTSSGIQLATRLMDQARPTVLAGTDGAEQPFFSPDGQWIGFFADSRLKKVSVQGGAAVTLCEASSLRGASWGEDGYILATLDLIHLSRLPAGGGPPQITAKPEEKGHSSYRYPQILPGGESVLLTSGPPGGFEEAAIGVLSLKTGDVKIVQSGGYFGRYLPSGHLVYIREGNLFGVPFDLKRMETRGSPAPVVEEILTRPGPGTAQLDVSGAPSGTGTLVYLIGKPGPGTEVVWMDATAKRTPLLPVPGLLTPRLSPDGNQLAISAGRDISVYDIRRGAMTRITFTAAGNTNPVWTPDGKYIAYASGLDGIWWTRADGSSQPVRIAEVKGGGVPRKAPGSFSPDGKRLAFYQTGEKTGQDIWILPLDTSDPDRPKPGQPELFVQTPLPDIDPAFSPDGRWLAYASAESGTMHVYVRPYPGGMAGGKWQISTTPGLFPVWARNGRQLFYEAMDGRIMVADYSATDKVFNPGKPRPWCDTPIQTTGPYPNFDLSPDGKRLVVIPKPETGGQSASTHAVFLVNFFDELKRRMP